MGAIYEARGRAKEFSELACNLYDSCPHGCIYCWVPAVLHRAKGDFHKPGRPRVTLETLESESRRLQKLGETRRVLFSFACDPYPCAMDTSLTRTALEILHKHGLRVTILTKGGNRALRDFDLLGPGDQFAVTLTFTDNADSERWEPGAALPGERIKSLEMAHSLGIETWVSLEPVIDPGQTKALVQITMGYVDDFKVGPLNYHPQAKNMDWKSIGWDLKEFFDAWKVKYYLKADLRYAMGIKEAGGSAGPQSKKAVADHVAGLVKKR